MSTFAVLVTAAPFSAHGQQSALNFCSAALAAGHSIEQIFFYQDGVYVGNRLTVPPGREPDPGAQWQQLADTHALELLVCVASALRRGILDSDEALRYKLDADNLRRGFTVSGLGQLTEQIAGADRLMVFG